MNPYLGTASRRGLLPIRGSVPQVHRLKVRVVTDSYHHAFEKSQKIGDLEIERFAFPFSDKPPRRTLQNEWGLALHVESARGAETRRILIDFGYTPEALNNNLALLRVIPEQLDALVLSHGHYDHFGGMAGFLRAHKSSLKPRLALFLGGEECYCAREAVVGNSFGNFGALDRKAIADAGLRVITTQRPMVMAGHGFSTGWIKVGSFEKVLSPTRMTVGMKRGLGCSPSKLPKEKRTGKVMPDDFQHEHATCFHVKGKGLVVITSCGHRGVVNSVRAAMEASGVTKVHAVLGGFHLAPHPTEYLRDTVSALKDLKPDYVIPMHCTGEEFIAIAQHEMPGKIIRSSTGTCYTFAA
jgi:7,8-dihydropterin-6-yl-methyl-4-(beta-D-ribofuranosyl)aminobenzene 5'-phosphate synthase